MKPLRSPDPTASAPVRRRDARLQRDRQKRRTTLVRILRLAIPVLMAAIVAVLAGWIFGHARHRRAEEAARSSAPVSIHMSNPRFIGRDARERPFVLTGTDAVRDEKDPHLVAITAPHLVLQTGMAQPFEVTGRTGLYHDDTHHLTLHGDVVVADGRGNRFFSDEGEMDTDSGDVVGRSHARAEGPAGATEGDAYALSDKGDHATFSGRVKTHWNRRTAPPAAPAATATKRR